MPRKFIPIVLLASFLSVSAFAKGPIDVVFAENATTAEVTGNLINMDGVRYLVAKPQNMSISIALGSKDPGCALQVREGGTPAPVFIAATDKNVYNDQTATAKDYKIDVYIDDQFHKLNGVCRYTLSIERKPL